MILLDRMVGILGLGLTLIFFVVPHIWPTIPKWVLNFLLLVGGLLIGIGLSGPFYSQQSNSDNFDSPKTNNIHVKTQGANSPVYTNSKVGNTNVQVNKEVISTGQSGGITAQKIETVNQSFSMQDEQKLSQQHNREFNSMMKELNFAFKKDDTLNLNLAKRSYPIGDEAIAIIKKYSLSKWQGYLPSAQLEPIYKFQEVYQNFEAAADDVDNSLQQFIRAYNFSQKRHFVNDVPAMRYCLGRFSGFSKEEVLREYNSNVEGTDDWVEDAFSQAKTDSLLSNKVALFLRLRKELKKLGNHLLEKDKST